MALIYTPTAQLGNSCPHFTLPSVDGQQLGLEDWENSKILVVMFICAHCPYVQAIEDRLLKLAASYSLEDVRFVGICSNDWADYPEDSPENLLQRWKEKKYPFPYLIDNTQEVAKNFGAVCTPDIFVYDQGRKLAYRGRLDDSWKDPHQVNREELRQAINQLLHHQKINDKQIPSMGCSIKWKENSDA